MNFLQKAGFVLAMMLIPTLFTFTEPAQAQTGAEAPAVKPAERPDALQPRLLVKNAEQPVRLVSLAVRTEIQGGFAESSLEMIFHNPNGRILEGELEFPLSPGQEISGLALDIGGELRRGVPVAKARGQEVFDDIARRKVDPALLEATRGNAYRLRVYPLPARGQRRVVVRIMQPLAVEDGGLRYRLPLAMAEPLDSVTVEAEIVAPQGGVKAEAGNLGLTLEQAGTIFRGRAERRNISPEGWLDISLPAPQSPAPSVMAARWEDKLYFSAAAQLDLPNKARSLPKLATILWDASGSGRERNREAEFALLDSYFQAFGSGQARLIVLRDKAEPPLNFKIQNGDWAGLKTVVNELVYDGATNLKAWVPTADCREYLLFSDGLSNWGGAGKFPALKADQRLFAVNSAPTADYAALRSLAVRGTVIDLAHESAALAEAKLLQEGARVSLDRTALADAAEAVLGPDSVYLSSAEGRGGLIRLAGWVKRGGKVHKITVRVVFSDGSAKHFSIPLPAWDKTPEFEGEGAPLAARLWGRYSIAELEGDYRANKKAIARLGERLGIVSRETSLIVLETAQDYATYGVTPPESLKAQVEALNRKKTAGGGEDLLPEDQLLKMWREKVAWWESDFTPRPKVIPAVPVQPDEVLTENYRPAPDYVTPPGAVRYDTNKVYTGEKISLDMQNAELHNVIRILGEISGKNIVVSDAVTGKITVKLKNVPWDQALDIVLSSRNLAVEEAGNVLTVYDLPTLTSMRSGRERIAAERAAPLASAPQTSESRHSHIDFSGYYRVNYMEDQERLTTSEPEMNASSPESDSSSINTVLGGGQSVQTQHNPEASGDAPYWEGASGSAGPYWVGQHKDLPVDIAPSPYPGELSTSVLTPEQSAALDARMAAAEATDPGTRILSAPRVMAGDGQRVSLRQGQQIPYASGSSSNASPNVNSPAPAAEEAPPRPRSSGPSAFEPIRDVRGSTTMEDSGSFMADAGPLPSRSGPVIARSESGPASEPRGVGLALKPWVSNAPYIERMRRAGDDELYAVYLDERPDYLNSSAFFIDAADRFFERRLNDLGLRVLSNLAEMKLENRQILRMLAYRLMQAGQMEMAVQVLEEVRELAPYEPQSLRDLAQAQAALGRSQEALDLLHETARRRWNSRFGEINTIALTEMNALLALNKKLKSEAIDSRLIQNLPSDIRVVLSWDMDNTDMDLWVMDPTGEAAYYGHKLTKNGGRMSRDCTQGYGPEEFMLKKAIPGRYQVMVDYFGHSRQTIAGEVTMMVTVISKFGTPEQKEERTTLRLSKTKDKVMVAEFTVAE